MSKRAQQLRQAARLAREEKARRLRHRRGLWISIGASVMLVIAAIAGAVGYTSGKAGPSSIPAHATASGDGIVTGTGPVKVEIYQDYLCPFCKAFHDSAGPTLTSLVDSGRITLVIHPIAILDEQSANAYSSRSAAASGCAADEGAFGAFNDALYANQPAEGTAGPTDSDLVRLGVAAGLTGSFATCVRGGTYSRWPAHVTDEASRRGVSGTPTVYVNGSRVNATIEAVQAAVSAAR
jgi:protein-disulfide isomerase